MEIGGSNDEEDADDCSCVSEKVGDCVTLMFPPCGSGARG